MKNYYNMSFKEQFDMESAYRQKKGIDLKVELSDKEHSEMINGHEMGPEEEEVFNAWCKEEETYEKWIIAKLKYETLMKKYGYKRQS